MPKVYVEGFNQSIRNMFKAYNWECVDEPANAELICLEGGADVDPSLYGEKNVASHVSVVRDKMSKSLYDLARYNNTPITGICRGGQFLNVMNCGKMWQDVNGHAIGGTHLVYDIATDRGIPCSSTHHQMMRMGYDGELVAHGYNRSTRRINADGEHYKPFDELDTEVVWYPKTKSLCFQPHPEMFEKGHPCTEYFFELLNRYMGF